MIINGEAIGGGRTFIIAEAGVNHDGDVDVARQLIDVAAEAGVDAVKFQSFRADALVSPGTPKAAYQTQATPASELQMEMLRRLQLSPEAHQELQNHCMRREILFLSTPFDEPSLQMLLSLNVPVIKIASGEITNWPFLQSIARSGKPVILSTGMSSMDEVKAAVRILEQADCRSLALLHCVSNYPALPETVNLRAMQTMATEFEYPVGYSDHTAGISVALAAVALGACIIEKHFTLDRNRPGPDHLASLEPEELSDLVRQIRIVERALGHPDKVPTPLELPIRQIARRSLAATRSLEVGRLLDRDCLTALRPDGGISPTQMDQVLGRRLRRAIHAGQLLSWDDLQTETSVEAR